MQRLEVSGAVRPLYWSLGVKGLILAWYDGRGKVQCALVQALRLCTGRTAHRGSRDIAVLYRH